MNITRQLKDTKGNLLIAVALIILIVMAVIVQFTSWTRQFTRANVHRVATQRALLNADSGIQMAMAFLRTPYSSQLIPGNPKTMGFIAQGTTSYVLMTRHTTDTSLV